VTDFLFARGAQAAEAALLAAVRKQVDAARAEPRLLATPIYVVVPSRELRDHLAIRLAHASATLGVEVLSLHALALRLHRDAGAQPESRSALVEILARRAAEQQPELRERLDGLQDGMGLAASSIRDLLSARALQGPPAIVQAARETAEAMQANGVQRPGDLQEAAADLIHPHLRARAILVHGFADATGQALHFLRALAQVGAQFVIDLPCDPADASSSDRGQTFVASFVHRLGGVMPSEPAAADSAAAELAAMPAPPSWQHFHAAGMEDEVREVAHRVRALLGGGASADEIGVVARSMPHYAMAVRRWFIELGIPFRGGQAPAALFPMHRRMQAALAVLRDQTDCPVDRWLDAVAEGSRERGGGLDPDRVADLRLAFRALGLGRLGQVAGFDAAAALRGRPSFPLPIRRGLIEASPSEEVDALDAAEDLAGPTQSGLPFEQQFRAHRRSIPAGAFISAFAAAAALARTLREWPQHAGLADHALFVERLLKSEFGWHFQGFDAEENWLDLVRSLGEVEIGPCTRSEFLMMLEREARNFGARGLGGASGVAVLDLTQARARTFQHLFVLGLNRGAFPRVIQSDPVFPDRERARLRTGFDAHDLQLAERGHDEERYLFAQLCSAAPQLCVSWLRADEDGKELPPSPYLQRLWLSPECGLEEDAASAVPRLRLELLAQPDRPRTGNELLIWAGLHGDRESWRSLLPEVLADASHLLCGYEASEAELWGTTLGQSRATILDEYEPDFATPAGRARAKRFGPWSGLLPQSLAGGEVVAVTRLERFASCAWQAFLGQHLHLEAAPDPLADLPDIDAALLGSTVHKALETLFGGQSELRKRAQQISEPAPATVRLQVHEAARETAYGNELRMAGLIEALSLRALPFVERALQIEFADRASVPVLGCEVRSQVELKLPDGSVRTLGFMADRADADPDGVPIFTDYKTARPFTIATAATRAKKLAEAVLRGERLQVAAYAAAAEGASGRYLFLRPKPGAPSEAYVAGLSHDNLAVQSFREVGGQLMAAREAGFAFARMEKPDGSPGRACDWCELSEACLRHDSGARRRLRDSLEGAKDELLQKMWQLPAQQLEDEK
jgi:PD-(D/E)XK nuclease superfamily protein